MRADEARDIDALARAKNRADAIEPHPLGCVAAALIACGVWVVLIAIVARLLKWGGA